MKTTTYRGIDYSGTTGAINNTNRDAKTGVRYGVIAQRSLNPDASEDIYQNGTDMTFEALKDEVKLAIRGALEDYISDYKHTATGESKLDGAVSDAYDAIEQEIGDNYQPENPQMRYEKEGYIVQTCGDTDFFVIKAPFYTYAQFCSPCVPGACNLDCPLKSEAFTESNKCYCLGHDWFDGNKAPYPVFNAETGEQVNPTT